MISALVARFSALPAPVRGAIWMVGAAASFSAMLSVVRPASEGLHAFQVAFIRHALTFAFVAPVLFRGSLTLPRRENLPIITLRAFLGFVSTVCWFYGVPHIELTQSTAINFTSPLWATVFAAIILGEQVRTRRWAATAVGFIGVLVVLRPGFTEPSIYAFVVMAGAAAWGVQHIVLRRLSQRESAKVIVASHSLFLTPMALIPAILVWEMPAWHVWAWLVVMSALGTLGHVCLTRSFAAAEASAVLPFDFTKMPVATLIGFLAYGEEPDLFTWVGAAIILAASVYIARREAQIARAARRAAPAPVRSDPPGTG
jgi:drug/metabolite transporter (DMT)-like permease